MAAPVIEGSRANSCRKAAIQSGSKPQRLGDCFVNLPAHRVFVHSRKGLKGLALQPLEPAVQYIEFGGVQGWEVGHRQGPQCVQEKDGYEGLRLSRAP